MGGEREKKVRVGRLLHRSGGYQGRLARKPDRLVEKDKKKNKGKGTTRKTLFSPLRRRAGRGRGKKEARGGGILLNQVRV